MNEDLYNPTVLVTEPRRRASSKLPLLWFALCDLNGTPVRYVQRRSLSEAKEHAALYPVTLDPTKTKRVVKPSAGYVAGKLARLRDQAKVLKEEIALWEGLT